MKDKKEIKKILLTTAGGIVCVGAAILIGKKINTRKFNGLELIEDGLYTFIDFDADHIVCTIDTNDVGRFMELLTKAENFIAENQAF